MQLKKIEISDKPIFDKYKSNTIHNQYLTFANLFLWKDAENIEYFFYNDCLVVTGIDFNKKRYFMLPCVFCITNEFLDFLKENFSDDYRIVGLGIDAVNEAKKNTGDRLSFIHERDMDNYIYTSEKLANLSGKKLHSKRNHINNFIKNYDYEFHILDDNNISEVWKFLEEWYEKKLLEDESIIFEKNAIKNGLSHYKELGFRGAFIKVGEKVIAFSMGDKRNDEMAVIHFEKADTDYAGAYAIINRDFVKNCWSDVKYINREDDMGIEGLRKSKLSYYPDILLEVYTAIENKKE